MNITKVIDNSVSRLNGELNGEKYWIEIEGGLLTPALRDALNKNATEPLLLAKEVSARITNWNLWKDEEGDLQPDFETISNLDDSIVYSLVDTIAQVWSGDKKKQKSSASA